MGHRPGPARAALGILCALSAAAGVAGCARPATGPGEAGPLLVVVVAGLHTDDPVLAALPTTVFRADDALASGQGATAVLELLDGRAALDQLREPADPLAWTSVRGWTARVDVLDPSLRSEPEWVHAPLEWEFGTSIPDPDQVDLHVVVAGRDQVDLPRLFERFRGRRLVVVGIPAGRWDRSAQSDAESVIARFRSPVISNRTGVEGTRTLADVLAPLRREVRRSAPRRAHWWSANGGGVLAEVEGGWVVAGAGRVPAAVATARDPEAVARELLPRGSLLVLIRGSESADLVSLEILTGEAAEWSAWGLEPIDAVVHPSPRYLQLDLAAEPEGDGILIADAHAQTVDVRLVHQLEDAPWIGAPVRDAASGAWLGFDGIRISPWSRDFWRLSRRTSFDAATWWPQTAAGIDLLWIREGEDPPAPIGFED